VSDQDMLTVEVSHIFLSNVGFVVLLKSSNDERSLPIFIGAAEAQAIAIALNDVTMPRPLTHDLLKNLLDFLECRLMRVEVSDVKEGTFFARLILDRDGNRLTMDCRPSDAIALALRCGAPMAVSQKVIEEAGRVFEEEDLEETSGEGEESNTGSHSSDTLKTPSGGKSRSPLDSLQSELEKAVDEERYEDAARLRDKIQQLKNTHTEN
jgi:bifunctional DNase/RNase